MNYLLHLTICFGSLKIFFRSVDFSLYSSIFIDEWDKFNWHKFALIESMFQIQNTSLQNYARQLRYAASR